MNCKVADMFRRMVGFDRCYLALMPYVLLASTACGGAVAPVTADTIPTTETNVAPAIDASTNEAPPNLSKSAIAPGDTSAEPPADIPTGQVLLDVPVETIPVANAVRAIAALRPGFTECHARGLKDGLTMTGSLTLMVNIAPGGEPASVQTASNQGIADAVVRCVAEKIEAVRFDPPGARGSVLRVPLRFVLQPTRIEEIRRVERDRLLQ